MKTIVLIPIYKEIPSEDEILSLKQCFRVLSDYQINIICPKHLNTAFYDNLIGKTIPCRRFAPRFFKSIGSYNNLMCSNKFYRTFSEFDYMLIYQLDAWVFEDKLNEWCERGFDYIGAPWFKQHKTYEEGYDLWCCGNGGLSLRRIKKFIEITSVWTKVYPTKQILSDYFMSLNTILKGLKILLTNNMRWYRRQHRYLWEDTYFCYGLDECRHRLNRPTAEEAAHFSFECSPSYLYEVIGNRLPFGCHAWRKFQYEDFWSKFIPGNINNPI